MAGVGGGDDRGWGMVWIGASSTVPQELVGHSLEDSAVMEELSVKLQG